MQLVGSSQPQNGGFQPQNGGSGKESQLCPPKSASFKHKIITSAPKLTGFISDSFFLAEIGDFCPKKCCFRPRNLQFTLKRPFCCFKNSVFSPEYLLHLQNGFFERRISFFSSLNVTFCQKMAILRLKSISLCLQTAFPVPLINNFCPIPKSLLSKMPEIGVFNPKLGIFFFSFGKEALNRNYNFEAKKAIFTLQKISTFKRSN